MLCMFILIAAGTEKNGTVVVDEMRLRWGWQVLKLIFRVCGEKLKELVHDDGRSNEILPGKLNESALLQEFC